jgi:excisionase family DNA binding protein
MAERGGNRMTTDSLITTREAAKRLHLNQEVVRRKIRLGYIPAVKVPGGRDWRIKTDDLDKILNGK